MLINELFDINCTINILSIMEDSRIKKDSSIYFCLKGLTNDGHHFINQAIENGAKVIIHSDPITEKNAQIEYIKVDNVQQELERVTLIFYDNPSEKLKMVGVTGTNGKTTIATVLYHLLNSINQVCGYMGTNGVYLPHQKLEAELTTVSNVELNEMLQKMVMQHAKFAALEVSSHGLIQNRVANIDFDVAIFTNISHDHLDFHKTIEQYALAKALLFEKLNNDGIAIINLDDDYSHLMISKTKAKLITYSLNNVLADYRAKNIEYSLSKTTFDLIIKGKHVASIETNLIASFNVSNLLAVIALLDQWQLFDEKMINNIKLIPVVDGRFEQYDINGIHYIVDYAHTPDGHEKLYQFIKENLPDSRLLTLFGSPGKRDKEKRYILGKLADLYADEIILTSEDPRDEDPVEIANQIASVIQNKPIHIISDRKQAINYSYSIAKKGDVVLVLGKGREQFNELADSDEYEGDDMIVLELKEQIN